MSVTTSNTVGHGTAAKVEAALICVTTSNTVGHGTAAKVVAQLVEALRYKPKGRGCDSRWSHLNFSVT